MTESPSHFTSVRLTNPDVPTRSTGTNDEASKISDLRPSTPTAPAEVGALHEPSPGEIAFVNELFEAHVSQLESPDEIAAMINHSSLGGSLQVQVRFSGDKSAFEYLKLGSPGTAESVSDPFSNTPQGLESAKLGLLEEVPWSQKLAFLHTLANARNLGKPWIDVDRRGNSPNDVTTCAAS